MIYNSLKLKIKNRIDKYLSNYFSKNSKSEIEIYNTKKGNNITIGNRTIIIDSIINNNIKIGNDSYLFNVEYGDYSYNSVRVSIMNCKIGKFCSIAGGVYIGSGMHPINQFVSTHPIFYSPNKQCGVSLTQGKKFFEEMGYIEIGNDVWIGLNAIILDNVKIGNGAVIAANSVVNKDVPDYAIVVGNPAKIIKYRYDEKEIKFLLDFKWWDKDINWLSENQLLMLDIKKLMEKYS